jgi:hypothetical protein
MTCTIDDYRKSSHERAGCVHTAAHGVEARRKRLGFAWRPEVNSRTLEHYSGGATPRPQNPLQIALTNEETPP